MHCVENAEFRNVRGDGVCTYRLASKVNWHKYWTYWTYGRYRL